MVYISATESSRIWNWRKFALNLTFALNIDLAFFMVRPAPQREDVNRDDVLNHKEYGHGARCGILR